MHYLEISEETFESNRGRAEFIDEDGESFGQNIDGKFYLYVNNGDKCILDIYEQTLQEILKDDMLFECMAIRFLDFEKHISDLLHWQNNGCKVEEMPFELDDIHYCDYNG